MRKVMYAAVGILLSACSVDPQKEMEKKIVGEWCNPYTYESTGELKGFNYKAGGVCEAINIPSLKLESWEIKDGYLFTRGKSINDEGVEEAYETKEKIGKLTVDTLELVVQEASPRLAFIYLRSKTLQETVTPQTAE